MDEDRGHQRVYELKLCIYVYVDGEKNPVKIIKRDTPKAERRARHIARAKTEKEGIRHYVGCLPFELETNDEITKKKNS